MKVIPDVHTFDEDPVRKLDFSFALDDPRTKNVKLYLSASPGSIGGFSKEDCNYTLDLECPNRFIADDNRGFALWQEENFDKILSISPQTTNIRNEALGRKVYETVFFPFSKKYIPEPQEKLFDLIFISNVNPPYITQLLELNDLRVCVVGRFNNLRTHGAGTYAEKLNLIAASKVSIVHNGYDLSVSHSDILNDPTSFEELQKYVDVRNHKTTQYKSRMMDAAFCKSFMLCESDEFNIIEDLFTENKHFDYFNEEFAVDKIYEIVESYDSHAERISDTFDYACASYTTEDFYKEFILNE